MSISIPEACLEATTKLSITVRESGRKFEIKNPERIEIAKVLVDGCLIDDERERCDYLFEIGPKVHCAVYVELKGSDVEKAYRQLTATLSYLSERHRKSRRICHIIASRVPKAGPKVQTLKASMARNEKVQLFVGTREVSVNVAQAPYALRESSD